MPKTTAKTRHLTLRENLYTHEFGESNPFFARIEVGINHIVLYPHPTVVGKDLLACIVASMWDKTNYSYFNVYNTLQAQDESGVKFIIDHSDLVYSNDHFNTDNTVDEFEHFHPTLPGGVHTHFSYGWQLAGLMAVYSVLACGLSYLSDFAQTDKENYLQSIVNCLTDYSKYVAQLLLDTLPEGIVNAWQKIFLDISQNGIFNAQSLKESLPNAISDAEFSLIRKDIATDDTTRILRTFIYDLQQFSHHAKDLPLLKDIPKFGDANSVAQLFNLACCLQQDQYQIFKVFSDDELQQKITHLENSADITDELQTQLEFVKNELYERELRKLLPDNAVVITTKNPREIDLEIQYYRERLSSRAYQQAHAAVPQEPFVFDSQEVLGATKIQSVMRPKAVDVLEARRNKPIPESDRIAAEFFLDEAVHYFRPNSHQIGDIATEHWPAIHSAVVHRTGDTSEGLMTTHKVHAIVYPNANINFNEMLQRRSHFPSIGPSFLPISPYSMFHYYPQTTVRASWYNAQEKAVLDLSKDVNVFGAVGTFEIQENRKSLEFTPLDASRVHPSFLASYGAQISSVHSDILYSDSEAVLYVTEYEFHEDYMSNYVLHAQRGGGLFIETHPFPHHLAPLDPSCSGFVILGKKSSPDKYSFAAFNVPFGYVLKIDANAIHSDSFVTGPHAISLTTDYEADVVLMRRKDGSIQHVKETEALSPLAPVTSMKFPLTQVSSLRGRAFKDNVNLEITPFLKATYSY